MLLVLTLLCPLYIDCILCSDDKCEPNKNPKNKINCRRNGVSYRISCLSCLRAGRPADVTAYLKCACYYGESAKNMHCRSKEHVAKFNSKSEKTRAESAFYKHLVNSKSLQKTFHKVGGGGNFYLKS